MATYQELLKDPRWQRKRLEVLEREDFTCENCEDTKSTLHVHHTYYKRGKKPWEYPSDSLQCLCEKCHQVQTESKSRLISLLNNQYLGSCEYDEIYGWVLGIVLDRMCDYCSDFALHETDICNAEVAHGLGEYYRVYDQDVLTVLFKKKRITFEDLDTMDKKSRNGFPIVCLDKNYANWKLEKIENWIENEQTNKAEA